MTRTRAHNGMDIIDSRDVIESLQELEGLREESLTQLADLKERITELEAKTELTADEDEELQLKRSAIWTATDEAGTEYAEHSEWDEAAEEEWRMLKAFEEQGSSEWKHGETLIREDYFETYAQELAEDIGALENCNKWPATCIDWERAARELQMDYTSAEFGDVTYYYRA